jgi:hypothetical protein
MIPWFFAVLYVRHDNRSGVRGRLVVTVIDRVDLLIIIQLCESRNCRLGLGSGIWDREEVIVKRVEVEKSSVRVGKEREKRINVKVHAAALVTFDKGHTQDQSQSVPSRIKL